MRRSIKPSAILAMAMSAGRARTGPVSVLDGGAAAAAVPAYACLIIDKFRLLGRCLI